MTQVTDHLTAEVARAQSVMASATTLITTLAGHIRDNAEDPVALNALADSLDASANNLASAITENTAAANLGGDTTTANQVDHSTGDGGAAAAGAADTGGDATGAAAAGAADTGGDATGAGTDTGGDAGGTDTGSGSSDSSSGASDTSGTGGDGASA